MCLSEGVSNKETQLIITEVKVKKMLEALGRRKMMKIVLRSLKTLKIRK